MAVLYLRLCYPQQSDMYNLWVELSTVIKVLDYSLHTSIDLDELRAMISACTQNNDMQGRQRLGTLSAHWQLLSVII